MARRRVCILGSTGSIGTQALDIIARHPDRFTVTALAASGRNVDLVVSQARAFDVPLVAVADEEAADQVRAGLAGLSTTVISGPGAASRAAQADTDVVVNGLAGAAGLLPTLAALEAGHVLALANKESLIIGGPLVRAAARPGQILPVDSEHSALAQCLMAGTRAEVSRLLVTASGGPFRGRTRAELAEVTPTQALAHPTWSMGPLVTINSATLVNKGLEVIEAHLLFDIPLDRIEVVVHPQSIVHSMVEFRDGSTIAQASPPDMRIPIAWAMAHPERLDDIAPPCAWDRPVDWEFAPLDEETFPAVRWARRAAAAGGTAPAAYNGADEECVAAFLAGELSFLGIVDIVGQVLQEHLDEGWRNAPTLDDVLATDAWARRAARALIDQEREGGDE